MGLIMKALDYTKRIKQSVAQLQQLRSKENKDLTRRRLLFLELLKSGTCCTQGDAGARIGIKQRASEELWGKYCHEGIEAIVAYPYKGRPPKLSQEAKADLQVELEQSRVSTLKQACNFVQERHDIHLSQVAMHYYFKQQKIKKKTGRPTNVRKDVEGEAAFKKKSFPT